MTFEEKFNVMAISILLLFGAFVGALLIDGFFYGKQYRCVEHAQVVSVQKITYRFFIATLSNGDTQEMSSVSVGDTLCVRSVKRDFLSDFDG